MPLVPPSVPPLREPGPQEPPPPLSDFSRLPSAGSPGDRTRVRRGFGCLGGAVLGFAAWVAVWAILAMAGRSVDPTLLFLGCFAGGAFAGFALPRLWLLVEPLAELFRSFHLRE